MVPLSMPTDFRRISALVKILQMKGVGGAIARAP